MALQDLRGESRLSWNNLHYHCDIFEINCLDYAGNNLDFSELPNIITNKNINEEKINDVIAAIEGRVARYGDFYPFELVGRSSLVRKETLSEQQKIYTFLLMCSYTNKIVIRANSLQSDFEKLSKAAMAKFLPTHSRCHIMGRSSVSEDRYTGHISAKMTKLAEDLHTTINFPENAFANNDSGDGGIDIVAWTPFQGCSAPYFNLPVYAGQSATGKNWTEKQTSGEKLFNYIKTPRSLTPVLFVPYDCRNSDGSFNDPTEIQVPLLFDRVRILNLVDTNVINDLTLSLPTLNNIVTAQPELA